MAAISADPPEVVLAWLKDRPRYGTTDLVKEVATREPYAWEPAKKK